VAIFLFSLYVENKFSWAKHNLEATTPNAPRGYGPEAIARYTAIIHAIASLQIFKPGHFFT